MVSAPFLFLKFYDGYAGIAFSEFSETEGSYMFLAFQVIVDTFSEGAGTFSVNNADGFHVCDVGVIQIFVQLCNCFVHGFSQKIDLCGNAGRF